MSDSGRPAASSASATASAVESAPPEHATSTRAPGEISGARPLQARASERATASVDRSPPRKLILLVYGALASGVFESQFVTATGRGTETAAGTSQGSRSFTSVSGRRPASTTESGQVAA